MPSRPSLKSVEALCSAAMKQQLHVRQFDLYQVQEQTRTQGAQKATEAQAPRERQEPAIARAPRVKPSIKLPTKALGMSR